MIHEIGRIVAVEPQRLQVETIQLSACGSCQAQKGCGHSLLAKFGVRASHLWILLEGRNHNDYSIGDEVDIGVPEDVIVAGSLFIYLVPIALLIAATLVAHQQALSDSATAFCAFLGLFLGGVIVRLRANQTRFDVRLQPVLVDDFFSARLQKDDQPTLQVIRTCSLE